MGNIISMKEINKDKYNELVCLRSINVKEFYNEIENIAATSPFPPNAYGCEIPMRVYEENDKYFVSWSRWSSCD